MPKHNNSAINKFSAHFTPISLAQLDRVAKMMKRSENKYVVSREQLTIMMEDLSQDFHILDIDGQRSFSYETIYFDDDGICYHDHVQGKRRRFKVRTRRYVDADLYYFEVKLKGKRGQTDKRRVKYKPSEHGTVTKKGLKLLNKSFKDLYKKDFDYELAPIVSMCYQRITLVAKKGGERMTLDYGLKVTANEHADVAVPEDFIIVETKSRNGNGIADKILRMHNHHAMDSCSKFCISMILAHKVDYYNRFLPLLKKYFSDYTRAEHFV